MTGHVPARAHRPLRTALLGAIGFYQRAISPTRPPRCRFVPTCSAYALEAVERYGTARGGWLALRRLLRCAPWHPGGVDLVPDLPERAPRDTGTGAGTTGDTRSVSASARTPMTTDPARPGHLAGLRAGPAAGDLR